MTTGRKDTGMFQVQHGLRNDLEKIFSYAFMALEGKTINIRQAFDVILQITSRYLAEHDEGPLKTDFTKISTCIGAVSEENGVAVSITQTLGDILQITRSRLGFRAPRAP